MLPFLSEILGAELHKRNKRQTEAKIHRAHLPYLKTFEEFDFSYQPTIDPKRVENLFTLHSSSRPATLFFWKHPASAIIESVSLRKDFRKLLRNIKKHFRKYFHHNHRAYRHSPCSHICNTESCKNYCKTVTMWRLKVNPITDVVVYVYYTSITFEA